MKKYLLLFVATLLLFSCQKGIEPGEKAGEETTLAGTTYRTSEYTEFRAIFGDSRYYWVVEFRTKSAGTMYWTDKNGNISKSDGDFTYTYKHPNITINCGTNTYPFKVKDSKTLTDNSNRNWYKYN